MINFRKLHRKTAPILFLPLLLTALTGIAYRIARSWFGVSDSVGDFFMTIHEGRFLGQGLVPIYVLLVGLGLLGMIVTGLTMTKLNAKAKPRKNQRWVHRILGLIAFLPLLISGITGIAYRLGKTWFGLSNEQASILMTLHQGSYLGQTLRPIYVLLVGLTLIGLLVTGIRMTGIFRRG